MNQAFCANFLIIPQDAWEKLISLGSLHYMDLVIFGGFNPFEKCHLGIWNTDLFLHCIKRDCEDVEVVPGCSAGMQANKLKLRVDSSCAQKLGGQPALGGVALPLKKHVHCL